MISDQTLHATVSAQCQGSTVLRSAIRSAGLNTKGGQRLCLVIKGVVSKLLHWKELTSGTLSGQHYRNAIGDPMVLSEAPAYCACQGVDCTVADVCYPHSAGICLGACTVAPPPLSQTAVCQQDCRGGLALLLV